MDRNTRINCPLWRGQKDVPRKGNVDRNNSPYDICAGWVDVPRKGNVDRNTVCRIPMTSATQTFPARGTWIEMD